MQHQPIGAKEFLDALAVSAISVATIADDRMAIECRMPSNLVLPTREKHDFDFAQVLAQNQALELCLTRLLIGPLSCRMLAAFGAIREGVGPVAAFARQPAA